MIDQAETTLEDLRKALRPFGLQIRSRRLASGPVFSVRDKESGEVLIRGLTDLDELRNRAWWILRTRPRGAGGTHAADETAQACCEKCGRARVGFFRFCLSCGFDFELVKVNREEAAAEAAILEETRGIPVTSVPPIVWRDRTLIGPAITVDVAPMTGTPGATDGERPSLLTARQLLIAVALGAIIGVSVVYILGVLGT